MDIFVIIMKLIRVFYFRITPFHHPPFLQFTIAMFYQFPFQSLVFTPKYLLFPPISIIQLFYCCAGELDGINIGFGVLHKISCLINLDMTYQISRCMIVSERSSGGYEFEI